MEFDQILKLIQAVSDSDLKSFTMEDDNLKLSLKKEKETQFIHVNSGVSEIAAQAGAPEYTVSQQAEPAAPIGSNTIPSGSGGFDHVVKSPLVGTFYSSASPDAPAFINVGDCVKKGQVVGIIEAMKLMNEIECDCDGVIEAILIENEQVVEYGQPLFRIK